MFARAKGIRGPVFLVAHDRLGLYVLGEDHRVDGMDGADTTYVLDWLMSYVFCDPLRETASAG